MDDDISHSMTWLNTSCCPVLNFRYSFVDLWFGAKLVVEITYDFTEQDAI